MTQIGAATLLVALACCATVRANSYNEINKYLEHQAPDASDAQASMKALKQLLEQKSADNKVSQLINHGLISALQDITALPDIMPHCNTVAIGPLTKALALARADKHDANGQPNRLDKLVQEYAVEHARRCEKMYKLQLNIINTELGSKFTDGLDKLADAFRRKAEHESKFQGPMPMYTYTDSVKLLLSLSKLTDKQSNVAMYWAMYNLVRDDVDGADMFEEVEIKFDAEGNQKKPEHNVDVQTVDDMFARHVVIPCARYVDLVRDTIEPAAFDAHNLPDSDVLYKRRDFFSTLARYHTCKLIIQDQSSLASGLKRCLRAKDEKDEYTHIKRQLAPK